MDAIQRRQAEPASRPPRQSRRAGARRTAAAALAAALCLAGCGDPDDDWPAEWVQVRASALPAGGDGCAGGGLRLDLGLDADGNGVLDPREMQWRLPVCDGVASVRLQAMPASWHCPSGSVQAWLGAAPGDGDARPPRLREWCLGTSGPLARSLPPQSGVGQGRGQGWLLRIEASVTSGRCPGRTVRLSSGTDVNRNGALDEGEVTALQELCVDAAVARAPAAAEAVLPPRAAIGQVLAFGGDAGRPWRLLQGPGQRINADRLLARADRGWSTSGPRTRWHALAQSADGRQLLVAGDEALLLSTDQGRSWLPVGPAQRLAWRGAAMSPDGRHLAATAADEALYTSSDGGHTWSRRSVGWGWGPVAMSDDGRVLLAVRHERLLMLSRDGGQHWDTVGEAGSGRWQAVAVSGQGRVLAAGGRGQPLQLSHDGGDRWTVPADAPPAGSLALSADGQRLFVAGGEFGRGGVHRSDDGGVSWHLEGPPALRRTRIVRIATSAHGHHVVAADESGTLWTGGEAGQAWRPEPLGRRVAALGVSAEGLARFVLPHEGEVMRWMRVTTPGVAGGLDLEEGQALALRYLGTGIWTVVAGSGSVQLR